MNELTDAIKSGDTARVEALIESEPSLLQSNENGVTPVLFAIYHGQRDLARMLAERSTTISFAEACALGDRSRAEALLAEDGDALDRRSGDGYPPLGLAIFFGHPELARWLIERGADVTAHAQNAAGVAPAHAAAAVCDRATMQLLLERGADANAKQRMDYTPLHGAASRGDIEMAKLLLGHGAQRDAKGTDGQTPADVARSHDQPAFAEWIEA